VGIELDAGPVERVVAEVAVVAFFCAERPLRGSAGRADWRLCGRLSELLASGRLSGERGEALLVETAGGMRAPLLLALGLGPRDAFSLDDCEVAARDAVLRVLGLGSASIALALLERAPRSEGAPACVEAVVSGAARAVAEREAEIHLRVVTGPDQLLEAQQALRSVRPRGLERPVALRLPAPQPRRAPRPGVSPGPPRPSAPLPPQIVK
jgi:hypothetical protein